MELSEKYQKRFGPLRYFVAGVHKFLCLPKYTYELEYLPTSAAEPNQERGWAAAAEEEEEITAASLFTDVMRRSYREGSGGLPRASSLSSIDSIMTPGRISGDLEMAGREPSDYVRGLDPKIKRLSLGRSNVTPEPEPQVVSLSATPNWPRTRSKSRGTAATMAAPPPPSSNDGRSSWAAANDKEEISSTLSDPGPLWDSEPKWDREAEWEQEHQPIELPSRVPPPPPPPPPQTAEEDGGDSAAPARKEAATEEERWVVKKGRFLGVLVCNHSCRTVQSLSSQVVAPRAEHDDNNLDLLLVHGSGRLRLLRFFLRLQCGTHLALPYVEYLKVRRTTTACSSLSLSLASFLFSRRPSSSPVSGQVREGEAREGLPQRVRHRRRAPPGQRPGGLLSAPGPVPPDRPPLPRPCIDGTPPALPPPASPPLPRPLYSPASHSPPASSLPPPLSFPLPSFCCRRRRRLLLRLYVLSASAAARPCPGNCDLRVNRFEYFGHHLLRRHCLV